MSDEERGDDLFGDSDKEAGVSRQSSPVASGSRSPAPPAAQAQSPVKTESGDEGGDLFGDDDEEEDRVTRGRTSTGTPASPRQSRSRSGSANPLEYEEEDLAEEVKNEEKWATLPIPQWNKMKATDDKVWHMKLPAYVNIESKPYEPDLYRETLNEEPIDGKTNPVAAKSKMIGVRNTIRWKWVTGGDGKPTRQSNARMLRWSDGSVSLQLGSDLFDVAPSHGATLARPQDPKPTPAKGLEEKVVNTVSSTTFLAVIAREETVLVTERSIAGQLSLLPTSMDSKTHLELVKHVGQQHVKHSRMKMLEETAKDEESLQQLLLKSAPNREFIKTDKDRAASSGKRRGGRGAGSGLGRTTSSNSLGGTKRRSRKSYYSDESDEGSEDDNEPRRVRDRSIGGGAGGDYDEDDGFVVADSDEDEYGTSSRKNKKSKKRKSSKRYSDEEDEDDVDEDDDDLDEMEQAERRIEAKERERKRAKTSTSKSGGKTKKSRDYIDTDEDEDDAEEAGGEQDAEGEEEEMEMDIESEEDQ
ncbi:hypothetical protein V865_007274 [Kwoniella europaea PYCC6329]|uniref:RNA polymerase-associated protein LEO1 n=1 Tax=Kwoniella europaea PYCC6329 TaxID=1423913 RepID=A0AAX4KRU1_9TREE